eukprot:3185498-Prymnesium_polylepis.2
MPVRTAATARQGRGPHSLAHAQRCCIAVLCVVRYRDVMSCGFDLWSVSGTRTLQKRLVLNPVLNRTSVQGPNLSSVTYFS